MSLNETAIDNRVPMPLVGRSRVELPPRPDSLAYDAGRGLHILQTWADADDEEIRVAAGEAVVCLERVNGNPDAVPAVRDIAGQGVVLARELTAAYARDDEARGGTLMSLGEMKRLDGVRKSLCGILRRVPTTAMATKPTTNTQGLQLDIECVVCGDPVTTVHEFPSGSLAPVCSVTAGEPTCWGG